MSRIGRKPIKIPSGVQVILEGQKITVKGPKGKLVRSLPAELECKIESDKISLLPKSQSKEAKAWWGLWRQLVSNMVWGVSQGFKKELELQGVGYRAQKEGQDLSLELGFSQTLKFPAPAGIKLEVAKNIITVEGIDKELVGNVAAKIRALRPVEPYKGKGIRYVGEYVRKKAGKKAVAVQ